MKIRRDIIDRLKQWKNSENRKPILLRGARQTGKTWIMQEFGKECFEYVAEFNFDKIEELSGIFEKTKDVNGISGKSLSIYTSKFNPSFRIRFSMNNLKENDGLLSCPIPLTDWIYRITGLMKAEQ